MWPIWWMTALWSPWASAAGIELAEDQFVLQEGGWAKLHVRRMRFPDPVGATGTCTVLIGETLAGEHEAKLGRCDEALAESAMNAAADWDVDAGKRDFQGQRAAFKAIFAFEPDEVTLLLEERWLDSSASSLPDGVTTWAIKLMDQAVPSYPKALRGSGQTAKCVIDVEIQKNGKPTITEITGCDQPFADSATAALKKWRWAPPLINGRKTTATTTVQLNFKAQ